jgi:hypothetical protein
MMEEIQIYQTSENMDISEKAGYDIQIATAKRYPRDVKKAMNEMIAIVTMDRDTAESCGYSIPRAGKQITGGSIHLAKIILQNYTNLRAEARISKITATAVFAEAICFDLQNNTAVKREASRKVVNKDGIRYNEDMIILTGQVCASIALREAIFSVVPTSIKNKLYGEALNFLTGDLSDETKLIKKRKQVIEGFRDSYKVSVEELLIALGLNSENQIKQEEIKILIGMAQALKDKEVTVDEMFERRKEKENFVPDPLKDK